MLIWDKGVSWAGLPTPLNSTDEAEAERSRVQAILGYINS